MEGAKASYFADAEIAMLSECVPTAQLRVVRRGHAARTQLILQQAWEIRRHSPQGHIMAPDIEWRDVPIVEEEPMLTGPGEVNEPQQAACPDIRCDNCRFWGGIRAKGELDQLERINRDYLGMGVKFCGRVQMIDRVTRSNRDPSGRDLVENAKSDLAFVEDGSSPGSQYWAALLTLPEYFCAMHEAKLPRRTIVENER